MSDRTQPLAARNPFSNDVRTASNVGALANAEQQRSIAEIQARMIIARSNPRDQVTCMDAILRDCTRPSLAAGATYQYAKGGGPVSGPSIRLAEAIAQRWGNIASGIKEVSRSGGYSECIAYAWDLETGYYDERQYQVRHWRDTRQGGYAITDEREIYELIANMGQRRKRAVLLTVIPGDVVEAALEECERTMSTNVNTSPEALKRLMEAFAVFGVTKAQIEKRCQCRIEAIRPAQIMQMSRIYTSIKDEMSSPSDWFDAEVDKKEAIDAELKRMGKEPATETKRGTKLPPSDRSVVAEVATNPGPGIPKTEIQNTAGAVNPHAGLARATHAMDRQAASDTERGVPPSQDNRVAPSGSVSESERKTETPDDIDPIEIWAVDEHGEALESPEPMTPMQFANWFAGRLFLCSNPAALREHNMDAIGEAGADKEAARIITEALQRHAKREAEAITAAAPKPVEDAPTARVPIPQPKTPKGSVHVPNMKAVYLPAAEAEIAKLKDEADIEDWIAVNRPNYKGLSTEIAIMHRLDRRREALGVGTKPPPDEPATEETLLTVRVERELADITTLDALHAWSRGDIRPLIMGAKATDQELYSHISAMVDEKQLSLEPKE